MKLFLLLGAALILSGCKEVKTISEYGKHDVTNDPAGYDKGVSKPPKLDYEPPPDPSPRSWVPSGCMLTILVIIVMAGLMLWWLWLTIRPAWNKGIVP